MQPRSSNHCNQCMQPLQPMRAPPLDQFPLKLAKSLHILVATVARTGCNGWGNRCDGCLHRLQGLPRPMQPLQATIATLATDACMLAKKN